MANPATEAPPRHRPGTSLDVALWLAAHGIHVHPLLPGKKLPPRNCNRCTPGSSTEPNPLYIQHTPAECKCIAAGRYCHGVHAATTNADHITTWWRKMPDAAVGVAAGPSGLLILDVDRHGGERPDTVLPGLDLPEGVDPNTIRDGLDVLALLCEVRQAPLLDVSPRTLTVRTPSGGLQYWYRVPEGSEWRSNSSKLGWQLDVKAGWGYGIAPGSVTAKGIYQRLGDCTTIAELPAWLAADLKRTGHYAAPQGGQDRRAASRLLAQLKPQGDRYVVTAVQAEVEELARTTEGGRNAATYNAARALGRFITTGQLTESDVESLVVTAAQAAGLSEREALTATRSGIRAGRARKVAAA
ncbi:bifunctional DNA primase/polymerase [Streptomyces eurythermus]